MVHHAFLWADESSYLLQVEGSHDQVQGEIEQILVKVDGNQGRVEAMSLSSQSFFSMLGPDWRCSGPRQSRGDPSDTRDAVGIHVVGTSRVVALSSRSRGLVECLTILSMSILGVHR